MDVLRIVCIVQRHGDTYCSVLKEIGDILALQVINVTCCRRGIAGDLSLQLGRIFIHCGGLGAGRPSLHSSSSAHSSNSAVLILEDGKFEDAAETKDEDPEVE